MTVIIFFFKLFSLTGAFLGIPGIFALVLIPSSCFFIFLLEYYFPFLKPFNDHVRFLVKGFFGGVSFVFFGIISVISYLLAPLWRFIKWLWSCIFGSKDIPSPKKPSSGPDLGGGPGDDPDDSDLPPPPKFPKRVEDIISKPYTSSSNSPSVTVDQIISNQQPTEISIAPSVSIISEPSPIIRSETISTEIEITSENQPIASPLISNNIEATVSENSTVVSQENINIDSSISSTVSSAPEEEPLVVVSDSQPPLDPDSGGEKVNFDIEIEKPQEVCLAPTTTVTEVSSTPSVSIENESTASQQDFDQLTFDQFIEKVKKAQDIIKAQIKKSYLSGHRLAVDQLCLKFNECFLDNVLEDFQILTDEKLQFLNLLEDSYSKIKTSILENKGNSNIQIEVLLKKLELEYFSKLKLLQEVEIEFLEKQKIFLKTSKNVSLESEMVHFNSSLDKMYENYKTKKNNLLNHWKTLGVLSSWLNFSEIYENFYQRFKEYAKWVKELNAKVKTIDADYYKQKNKLKTLYQEALDGKRKKKMIFLKEKEKDLMDSYLNKNEALNRERQSLNKLKNSLQKQNPDLFDKLNKQFFKDRKFEILLIFIPSSIKYFKLEFSWNNLLLFITVLTLILTFYRYFNGEALGAAYLPIIKEIFQGIKEWIKTKWC